MSRKSILPFSWLKDTRQLEEVFYGVAVDYGFLYLQNHKLRPWTVGIYNINWIKIRR